MGKGGHFTYIVRCKDGSLYTGWTRDVSRRVKEHNEGKKGAKYTRNRRPVQLVYFEEFDSKEEAMSREWHIKHMDKLAKEKLVAEKDNYIKDNNKKDNYKKYNQIKGDVVMGREIWKPGNMLYPLPVVMVSCKKKEEKANIITIAWAGTINSDPPMVSISVRPERHSYHIIKETGEFVINLVTEDLTFATDFCGVKSGRDKDKFKEMNLHQCPGVNVEAPGIEESPVNIECKVKQVIPLGSHDMFIAEVVGVQVNDKFMDETGKFNLNSTGLVTYSHGEYYTLGEKLGKFGYSVRKGI